MDQKNEWTPIKEGYPKKKDRYFVTAGLPGNEAVYIAEYLPEQKIFNIKTPVIAWMKLPTAYSSLSMSAKLAQLINLANIYGTLYINNLMEADKLAVELRALCGVSFSPNQACNLSNAFCQYTGIGIKEFLLRGGSLPEAIDLILENMERRREK